jgi:hypothetical protein
MLKHRLDNSALASMGFALAGQQTFTEDNFCALQPPPLFETPMIRDQDILDQFRFVDEVHLLAGELEKGDRTVRARQLLQKFEAVLVKPKKEPRRKWRVGREKF